MTTCQNIAATTSILHFISILPYHTTYRVTCCEVKQASNKRDQSRSRQQQVKDARPPYLIWGVKPALCFELANFNSSRVFAAVLGVD